MNNIPLQLVGRKTLWSYVSKTGEKVIKEGTIVGNNTDDYYKNKLDDDDSEDLDKLWLDDPVLEKNVGRDVPLISNEALAHVVKYETQQHLGAQDAYNTLPFFFQYFQQLQYWQSTTTSEPVGRFQHRYPVPVAFEDNKIYTRTLSSIKLERLTQTQRKTWAMKAIRHAFCPSQCLYQGWSMYYNFSTLVSTFKVPTFNNTEKPLEVNSPLHLVLEHALFCVPLLRGAVKIKNTSMIRVLHATYQGVKNLSDPEYVKKQQSDHLDINRIRCVYIILQSGCQRLRHNNIICQQTGDALVAHETAQRCFQYRKSSRKHPTIVLECRVLLPILYDFKPHFSRLPTPETVHDGCCQLERLVYLAKKHKFKDVELVSRMRLSLEKEDATIHAEVRHELFYGTVIPVGKGEGSLTLAEDLAIAVYGGFLAETTQVERWSEEDGHGLPNSRFRLDAVRSSKSGVEVGETALAKKYHNRLQGKKKKTFIDVATSFLNKYQDKKKHWTQRVLMLTHGCQYCLLWNHMARENHRAQYLVAIRNIIRIKEFENAHDLMLAVIDGKKPDMHAVEKIDLYLECLCLLPHVSDHLDKDTCQKLSDAVLPYVLNKPSNQFYHLYMVIQFVIMAYDCSIQCDEPMELVQVQAGIVSGTYAKTQSNPPMYKALHGSNRLTKYTVQNGSSMWFLSTSEKEQDDYYYNQSSSDMVPLTHWKKVYPNKDLPPCHVYTSESEIICMSGEAWKKHSQKRNCYGKKSCALENCVACQPSNKRRKKSFTKEECWRHLRCADVEGKECMQLGNVPEKTLVAWDYEGYYFQFRRGTGVDPIHLQYVDRKGNVLPCEEKWMVAADDMVYVLENGFLLTRFHNSHAIVGKEIQDLKLMDWLQMTVPKWNNLYEVQEHRISEQNGRFFREGSQLSSLHEYEAVRLALVLREFMLTQVPMLKGATLVPGQTYLRLKQRAIEHTAWHTDYQNVVEDRDDNTIDATNWKRVRTVWVPLHDIKKSSHSILQFRNKVKNGYTAGEYVIFGLKVEHMANACPKPRYSMDFRVLLKK